MAEDPPSAAAQASASAFAPSANFFYAVALFAVCSASGGVVLGVGAFAAAAVEQGVLHGEDIPIVFDIGFQMLTWMSLAWSLQHDLLGPRAIALLGLAFAFVGNLMIAAAARSPDSSPYVYALAYGLIGGGGNGCFIGSFQFASLFESQGTRCAVLSSGFNVAGYVYLLLNVPGVSISGFYAGNAAFVAALAAAVAVTYPDRAYKPGDTPTLRWPTLGRRRAATTTAPAAAAAPAAATAVVPAASAAAPPPKRGCLAETYAALRLCAPALREPRFWGYCATFSWAALVAQWASGAVGSGLIFPGAGVEYLKWGMSTITNATFLISPLIGHLIDRLGFRPVGLLLVLCMPAVILCLWWEGPIAQWLALVLICLLNALAFTVQFAYLTITFSSAYYPGLLTITLAVQGTLGFIAWPLLVEVAPFGHDPCLGNFLLMAAPTPLLLAWPLGRGSVNGKGAGRSLIAMRTGALEHPMHVRLSEG